MTANRHPVGLSSFSDGSSTSPRGKMQHVSTLAVAQQIASVCYEFDTQYPGALERGDRATINEGIREDDRALQLYADYVRDPAHNPLAAYASKGPPPVITTTHRAAIGTAIDVGITRKDGTNRAMTPDENAWWNSRAVLRGILATGLGFARPEAWHRNGGYAAVLPPITGVNLPGAQFHTTEAGTPAGSSAKGNEPLMKIVHSPVGHTLLTEKGAYKFNPMKVGKQTIMGSQQIELMQRVIDAKDSDVLHNATEFGDAEVAIIAAVIRKAK